MMSDRHATTGDLVFALPAILRLLWRVVRDERISLFVRGGLIAIAAYLTLPFDLLPDSVPLIGRVDDFVILTFGVRTLLRQVPDAILREHWTGEERVLDLLLGRDVRDPLRSGL